MKRIDAESIIKGLQNDKSDLTMENAISEKRTKELMTEVLSEMMHDKREVFYEIVLEALEDVGLANAIKDGRKNDYASEDEVMEILKG